VRYGLQVNGSKPRVDVPRSLRGAAASLFAMAVLAGLIEVCLVVGPAVPGASQAAAAGAPGSWQVDKYFTPTPGDMNGISCPTTTNCVAVGTTGVRAGFVEATADGGASWVADNAPPGVSLLGVSCPSAVDCTAVGTTAPVGGVAVAIGTTNGGATWTPETIPSHVVTLSGISCPSTTTCTAVGATGSSSAVVATANGGTTWTAEAIPTNAGTLNSISCPSTTTCVAVGEGPMGTGAVETTDGGSTWSLALFGGNSVSCPVTSECVVVGESGTIFTGITTYAEPIVLSGSCTLLAVCTGGTEPTAVQSVSCPSTSVCISVGGGQISTTSASGWTTQTAPVSAVNAVSCSTSSDCMAAGWTSINAAAVVNTTNGGTNWATDFVAPDGVDDLVAVSCPTSTVCTAVGDAVGGIGNTGSTQNFGSGVVVNTADGGATWTQQTLPAATGSLGAISCASVSVCEALGNTSSGGSAIVGTTDGGATWLDQVVPSGFAAGDGLVCSSDPCGGMSCPSTSDCTAVNGTSVIGTTNGGTNWTSESVSSGESLDAVACSSTTRCTAVGSTTTSDPSDPAIVATSDGGATWTAETPPSGFSSPNGFSTSLVSVVCPSTTSCVALGDIVNTSLPIISTSDGGATWTMPGDIPESPHLYQLNQIACTSSTACMVVGEASVNDGPGVVEATSDGGATWATQSAPSSSLEFKGIACPAAGACIAVGDGPYTSGAIVIGQAPTTRVLVPSNGAAVNSGIVLDAGASSPVGIASANFEVSGGSISDKVVSSSGATLYGYIGEWDTTDVPNGIYTLQSVATDTLGQSSTSAPVTVAVNNPPPTTSVLIPSNGATQSGTAALVDASASAKVTSVSFELSSGTLTDHVVATATPTLYGWLAQWNTTTVPNGTYTLQSVATYVGGVSGTSPGLTITVNNPQPTTSVLIPSNGASQSGTTALLDASASPGVTSVTYELTGGTLSDQPIATGTPTYYGWLAEWNTKTVPNGTYSLISVAAYAGGVSGTSTTITITVSN
jgi:Bacterial Ig domain